MPQILPLPDRILTFSLSGLISEEPSIGPVSHLNPKDIVVWSHSIPAPEHLEDAVQSVDWTESFIMRHSADDAGSPSSSMDDSAYVSLQDGQRQQVRPISDAELQFTQDNAFLDSDPQMMPVMFSPSVSAMSYQAQVDTSAFVLPPSSEGSIPGELGSLAISHGTLWQMPSGTSQSPANVTFSQGFQGAHGMRHDSFTQHPTFDQGLRGSVGSMSQDCVHMNASHIPYMPSQSPDIVNGQLAIPSRTSSRATMSGYASGGSGTAQPTPFTSARNSASLPMLRQLSSGVSSTAYPDVMSSMSPTSPGMSINHTSPSMELQLLEDYSEYINLDQ
jgi:hypothetical protein